MCRGDNQNFAVMQNFREISDRWLSKQNSAYWILTANKFICNFMNKKTLFIVGGVFVFITVVVITVIIGIVIGLNFSNDTEKDNENKNDNATTTETELEEKNDLTVVEEESEEEININNLKINKKFDFAKYLITWKIDEMSINEETDEYVIDVKYPKLVNYSDQNVEDNFNNIVRNKVDAYISDVTSLPQSMTGKNSITLDYEIDLANSKYISILVVGDNYTGGAHPNPIVFVINYDLVNMEEMDLSDLFISGSDYLNELSTLSDSKLSALLGDDYWGSGAEPNSTNFQNFTFNDSRLRIVFGAYQVGPYVIGTPEVEIQFDELDGFIKADL